MNKEIVKDEVILDVKGLSQLIWKLAFTEAIPEVVKMLENKVTEEEFHTKATEMVTFLANAVYQVITEDELNVLFPEILTGINLVFLNTDKSFNMYIKKAKQDAFKKNVFESFVASMFLMSIETILKMQQGVEAESEDIREELVLVEGGESEKPTISE